MPLGPIVPVSRDDNVATRVIGGGAGIARAYKQGRRAARSVYGFSARKSSRRGLLGKIFDKLRIQGRMYFFEKKNPECFKSRFDTAER